MARIDIKSAGATLSDGVLQLENGVAMDTTLRNVADQNNTTSPLKLSTTAVQVVSPLRITTDDPSDMYLDCEDGATNNRFNITRNTASQQVNLNFASNPVGSTSIVGGIRTFVNGVNLSEVMAFREDGQTFVTGNTTIGNGTTAIASRLAVKGSGSTGATSSLLVQNSAGVTALEVLDSLSVRSDNSQLFFTNTSVQHRLGLMTFTNNSISCLSTLNIGGNTATNFSNTNLNFQTSTTFSAMASPNNATRTGISIIGDFTNSGAGVNSVGNNFNITTALNTSIGNVTLNQFNITNTVNTTGGTTLQRGFYYNPTLTGTVGFTHYAIQTTSGGAYINTTTPQASACLQADSTTQGFLPPRMTNAERAAITTPAIGLMVYCTDAVEGLYVYKSTGWTFVI